MTDDHFDLKSYMEATAMTEREEFEAWRKGQGLSFSDPRAIFAWSAWQARASRPQAQEVAASDARDAIVEVLQARLADLLEAADNVGMKGAVTGPQWTEMIYARNRARAALASQAGKQSSE